MTHKLLAKSPRLGDYFSQRQEMGRLGLPTLSVTLNEGLVPRDELERRTESTLTPEEHSLVCAGDIAYNTMRMWQGACGVADYDGLVSPAYIVMVPGPGMDERFAYHWFKSERMLYLFRAYSHGLTEDRLRLYADEFAEVPATPPPLAEQRRWATILDEWDRTIDRTERLIAAKRRRLVEVRRLVLSDLAEPEVELRDLATVTTGVPAPQNREAFISRGIRFVRVSDLAALVGDKVDEPEYLTDISASGMRKFPRGTVLFAKSGMSCKLSRVVRLPFVACLVSHLGALNAHEDVFQSFLFHWLVEHPPSSLVQGDGFPSIRVTDVSAMPVPGVSAETAARIGTALDALEEDVRKELAQLSALRMHKRGLVQKIVGDKLKPRAHDIEVLR